MGPARGRGRRIHLGRTLRVVVIGAGLSGLMAARSLAANGHEVNVLDKGRGVGGRLATRRIGDAVLDHGAQFFTVRTDPFAAHVDEWLGVGVAHEWCRGFDETDGHPRYVGSRGMTGIAKHLASGLEVRTGVLVESVRVDGNTVGISVADGSVITADRVIITAPLPQTAALLAGTGIELPPVFGAPTYVQTLGLLVVLDSADHAVPAPGGLQNPRDDMQFVGDNMAKGISPVPALTFHFAPGFSAGHFEDDDDALTGVLMERARPWVGRAGVAALEVKKWRYATPIAIHPAPCWTSPDGMITLAGDAFAGPRVEAAALSGLAAAGAVRR